MQHMNVVQEAERAQDGPLGRGEGIGLGNGIARNDGDACAAIMSGEWISWSATASFISRESTYRGSTTLGVFHTYLSSTLYMTAFDGSACRREGGKCLARDTRW